MNKTNAQLEELAETMALEFLKVSDKNPNGLTDSWVLFQARNAHGVFLTPRQCLKVGRWARQVLDLHRKYGQNILQPSQPVGIHGHKQGKRT